MRRLREQGNGRFAANSGPMHRAATIPGDAPSALRRQPARGLGQWVPCLAMLLLLSRATACLASGTAAPGNLAKLDLTAEWGRLVALWQTMLDHSEGLIYNPGGFRELSKDLETATNDLSALAKRGPLPDRVATDLGRLFQDRHAYISTRHYTSESNVTLDAFAAAQIAAQWVVEMELAVLRRAASGSAADQRVAAAAADNLAFELTFLSECRSFDGQVQRRRQELQKGEKDGKPVDWQAFENERQRRSDLLLQAYRQKSLKVGRSVRDLMPYLLALTRAEAVKGPVEPAPGRLPI